MIMSSTGDNDLLVAIKKLVAENKSLETRLEDCLKIIEGRDFEIELLQTMLTEANEYRSTLDSQVKELNDLQQYLSGLQKQEAQATFMINGGYQQAGTIVSIERQFENLSMAYTNLQSQLTGLQSQLLEMNKRNLLLQLQTGRISELESLLENVEREKDEMNSEEINPA
jgi:ppGpp synthetase/RelA/SpoT-type nucleotidyltranferase